MDDVSLEIVGQDARVTGRDLPSFDGIGPGLLEVFGAMEVMHESSLAGSHPRNRPAPRLAAPLTSSNRAPTF